MRKQWVLLTNNDSSSIQIWIHSALIKTPGAAAVAWTKNKRHQALTHDVRDAFWTCGLTDWMILYYVKIVIVIQLHVKLRVFSRQVAIWTNLELYLVTHLHIELNPGTCAKVFKSYAGEQTWHAGWLTVCNQGTLNICCSALGVKLAPLWVSRI